MTVLEKIKKQLDELDGRVVVVTKRTPKQDQTDFRKIANAR